MVAIAPLRAIHYASRLDAAKVTSPPYDVISPEQRAAYAAAEPHNIVRVILPEQTSAGYADAAAAIDQWLETGAFERDQQPGFYTYTVHYRDSAGTAHTMRGFFARVAVDPKYDEVRRHEATLKKAKVDRLNLRKATSCDTEPIQLLYRDERGWVDEVLASNEDEPILDFTDEQGYRHVVAPVTRAEGVGEVVAQFEDKKLVIADGHHRYQTAVNHYTETGRQEDGSVLAVLVRDQDPGIRIDPTHRLLRGLDMDLETALAAAGPNFDIEAMEVPSGDPRELPAAATEGEAFVLLHADAISEGCIHVLRLKADKAIDEGRGPLDKLSITRLHERLLRDCWGITQDNLEDHISYTREDAEAVEAVRSGKAQMAILPPRIPVHSVLDVSQAGHVMPQKSTFFIPKLRSGLILSPLDEPRPVPWTEIAGDGGKPPEFRMPNLG